MLARTVSASLLGVEGLPVRVEVDVAFGLPSLTVVGLAGSAVQEARERVRSALRNSGFELPARRITVNLAPADLPKEGTGYDLAIAVGILAASGQLPSVPLSLDEVALLGELALDGGLQPISGAMALVAAAREAGIAAAVVPLANEAEGASVAGVAVYAARSLGDVVAHLSGVRQLEPAVRTPLPEGRPAADAPDMSEVIGQQLARRALEIAIAGRHSLALSGPPGIGKTLLLRAAAGLLPPLDDAEAIEVSRIYSVAGLTDRRSPLIRQRPFRAPHHTVSTQALVGGGPRIRPGEASLAHHTIAITHHTAHTQFVTRAAVYCRISEDREGAGLGVQRQEADCRELAERLGWDVEQVYTDNDLSAYSGRRRPAYETMLSDADGRAFDAILAWHPDRLHRSPRELEDFIDLCERRGVSVQTVRAGAIDLATPSGRMVARTVGSVARYESEHKSDRLRRKMRELAEAGDLAGGGTRPYGMEDDRRTVRPGEAAIVRESAERLLAGEPLRGIARDLNTREVPTVTGTRWSTTVLRRLLSSGRIAGWREHHAQLTAEGDWQAIIDRPTLDRLRALLRDPTRRTTTGPAVRSYLLAGGLSRCGRCGAPMRGAPRADGTRRYICRRDPAGLGCNGCAIVAVELEAHVRDLVLDYLDTPALAAAIEAHERQSPVGIDLDALHADEEALEELARDYYAEHRIGRSEYLAARDALQARIAAARRTMSRTNGTDGIRKVLGLGPSLRAAWEAEPFDWRRALVLAVVERVTIGPGRRGYNRFEPARVTVEWRY